MKKYNAIFYTLGIGIFIAIVMGFSGGTFRLPIAVTIVIIIMLTYSTFLVIKKKQSSK